MSLREADIRVDEARDHYERFYPIADRSKAHSLFCQRVYGKDLCQDGQTDMRCFDEILERLGPRPGDHVLDLGCGVGGLAEYLSDRTGARVTGIDNSASAIATATARTTGKRDRLTFVIADINALDLPAGAYDAAIAIDSISWVTNLSAGISAIVKVIRPGGQLCIVTEQRRRDQDPPEILEVDRTPVAAACSALQLRYESTDYTPSLLKFWTLARETAEALRENFIKDGAGFICDTWIRYADQTYLPAIRADRIRRYFYHVAI